MIRSPEGNFSSTTDLPAMPLLILLIKCSCCYRKEDGGSLGLIGRVKTQSLKSKNEGNG